MFRFKTIFGPKLRARRFDNQKAEGLMKCSNSSQKLAIRDANLRQIQQQGRYAWRVASGCTRQSLAENAVFRFKAIFGLHLRARRLENRKAEGLMKCDILNRMTSLGMPMSERMY